MEDFENMCQWGGGGGQFFSNAPYFDFENVYRGGSNTPTFCVIFRLGLLQRE